MNNLLAVGLNQNRRIIGKKFGRLTIIEPTSHRAKNGSVLYRAACDCGNETLVRACDLPRSGKTSGYKSSCGCLKREAMIANGKKRFKDLSGSKIGKLLVIRRDDDISQAKPKVRYLCLCECGQTHHVLANNLNRKRPTKSCGCSKNKQN